MKVTSLLLSLVVAKSTSEKNEYVHPSKHSYADLDLTKRPVIGILTEPLRGEISNAS